MEVRPGYKQTEVGVIPNDWSVRSVGDVCGFIVPGRNKPRHFNGEIPCVTTPDLEDGRSVSASRVGLCVTRAEAHTIGSRVVPVGSVLMSCAGDLGITAITRKEVVINQQLHAFIPSPQVNAVFLLNVIASQRPQIAGLATKTAVPYLNKNDCNSIHIPVPPVAEQEAIAEALNDADALIESLEQLLTKKRHLKQGAMQELLTGKKRLPGFEGGNPLTPTEIGTFPADWLLRPLRSLIDSNRGIRYGIVQPGKYDPNGRYMIRGQDYSEAKGWAKPTNVFRVADGIEQRYRNARVKEDDLIMTIVGYCGHVEMVPDWLDGANLTQTTARIAIQPDKAIPAYCKYVLQSDIGKEQVAVHVKGAAQPGLNCGDVEHFLLETRLEKAEQISRA